MIGIVIVSHGQLADALLQVAHFINGKVEEGVRTVSIDVNTAIDVDKLRNKIASAVKEVNQEEGVIILTDMFGGSPSNLSYSFLKEGKIEVLSGVNLPVLIKALEARKQSIPLTELAMEIEKTGKRSISLASGILKGSHRSS